MTNAENEEPWGKGNNSVRLSIEENEDEEPSRLAISTFQARVEEIERKKMEVKEKVELQLGRSEEETRRLAQIWEVSSRNLKVEDKCIPDQYIFRPYNY